MSDLRKAAEMALESMEEGEYGHAEQILLEALSQPEQECVYPECETGIGCDGPCGEKPVDTVNTSQERETAKRGHEPDSGNKWKNVVIIFNDDPPSTGHDYDGKTLNRWSKDFDIYLDGIKGNIYIAPPKREWVELTDDEIYDYVDQFLYQHGSDYGIKSFCKAIEAKLKEKNT